MTENDLAAPRPSLAPSFGKRVLRAWPWLTAANELILLSTFGAFAIANELRVAASYETAAGKVIYDRYVACEDISAAVSRWSALSLIPILLTQCIAWSWIRSATGEDRRIGCMMPITTVFGLLELAFVGFLCAIGVSASMVG